MGKDYVTCNKTNCSMYSFALILQDYGFAFDLKKNHKSLRHCLAKNRFDFYTYQLLYMPYISSSLRTAVPSMMYVNRRFTIACTLDVQ